MYEASRGRVLCCRCIWCETRTILAGNVGKPLFSSSETLFSLHALVSTRFGARYGEKSAQDFGCSDKQPPPHTLAPLISCTKRAIHRWCRLIPKCNCSQTSFLLEPATDCSLKLAKYNAHTPRPPVFMSRKISKLWNYIADAVHPFREGNRVTNSH